MKTKQCSRCGATFGCGRDDAACWCVALPKIPLALIKGDADCLCPACLTLATTEAGADDARPDPAARD